MAISNKGEDGGKRVVNGVPIGAASEIRKVTNNSGQPFRILCIEDNAADIELLKFLFSQCEPKVETYFMRDGLEGSNFLFKRGKYLNGYPTPDLILMDLNMPKVDGLTLVRELKADREVGQIPVVILSTSSTEREVAESYGLGANAFISKPTDLEKFQTAIQRLLWFYFECTALPTRGRIC